MNEKQVTLVNAKDLSLIDAALNKKQLAHLLKHTPAKYVRTRPAKGGGTWKYVSGGYVKKVLNLMFGFDWDFQILNQQVIGDEAIVQGRLTIRTNGKTIIKEQFGNKAIMYKSGSDKALSIGNDLKAACTDCLKKCAAEIGIAADIYNPEEFREVAVDTTEITLQMVDDLYELKKESVSEELKPHIERVISGQEKDKYESVYQILSEL